MDMLKRALAPITDAAWEEIENVARDMLPTLLSARRVVDVEGPKGWDYAALPLGRLSIPKTQSKDGTKYGVHTVQPLVEVRVPFELDVWELDNIERGAKDIDLDPLKEAVTKIARFEESAIYEGFGPGHITGLRDSSEYKKRTLGKQPQAILEGVSAGVSEYVAASVKGPYALVVGSKLWRFISSRHDGYPLTRQLERLIEGSIVLNPFGDDTFLVSLRGGDLRLVLGHDLAIGYNRHDQKKVELFLTESFTFQVIDGSAVMVLDWKQT
jgi:uncharacterized linocin/CFP29 family protein